MVLVPAESSAASALEEYGLFRFEPPVIRTIASFFDEIDAGGVEESVLRFGREMVYLSSAEFSLIPRIFSPDEPLLPLREPLVVEDWAGRLALLKTDCLPDWGCCERAVDTGQLPLWDLTLFASDVSKLYTFGGEADRVTSEQLSRLIRMFEARYRESSSSLTRSFGSSGAIRLQGLIWRMKQALVAREDLQYALDMYLKEFHIAGG
jgi:hypothetical protein